VLKTGGEFCFGQTCFNKEVVTLPGVFLENAGWKTDYENYHSPKWWKQHMEQDDLYEVYKSKELDDGDVYWHDHFIYHAIKQKWSKHFFEENAWLMNQILYGINNDFYLTHLIMTGRNKEPLKN